MCSYIKRCRRPRRTADPRDVHGVWNICRPVSRSWRTRYKCDANIKYGSRVAYRDNARLRDESVHAMICESTGHGMRSRHLDDRGRLRAMRRRDIKRRAMIASQAWLDSPPTRLRHDMVSSDSRELGPFGI